MITTEFNNLSFHDTSIESISRSEDSIIITFQGAFLSKNHSDSEGIDWWIDKGTLKLIKVTKEVTLFWEDTEISKPHPSPEIPLDEIMNASFDGELFYFNGFLDTTPWFEWSVNSTGFELVAIEKHNV